MGRGDFGETNDGLTVKLHGKEVSTYKGLLAAAHHKGLLSMVTEVVVAPTKGHELAVIKATVVLKDGRTFTGIGDATPSNVKNMVAPHYLRMAETRAKARALRDALNVGAVSVEELIDMGKGGEYSEEAQRQESEASLKAEKSRLLRTVTAKRRELGHPPEKGAAGRVVVAIALDRYERDTLDSLEEVADVAGALDDYDLTTGERIPEGI
ncbi:hypothetical protein H8E07_10100 [bacterium]|nr:hypothetical protein [bacterium]